MKRTVFIAGGDLRQAHLARLFSKDNNVLAYGFDQLENPPEQVILLKKEDVVSALKQSDILILPMPAMENETYINAPFSSHKISAEFLLDHLSSKAVVYGGKITNSLENLLSDKDVTFYDYLKREELAIMNAIPTAEGTLQIIFEELPVTVYGLSVLIIGSGRISRVLWKYLKALGANVSVTARKHSDLSWIKLDGCKAIHTQKLNKVIDRYDLIINTVPAVLLTDKILSHIKSDALLIDLASKPGGVNFEVANQLGIKTIWALSLPGKVAPLTAGEIIYHTIENMLEENIGKEGTAV